MKQSGGWKNSIRLTGARRRGAVETGVARRRYRREDEVAGTMEKNGIGRISRWLGGWVFFLFLFLFWILDTMNHVDLSGGFLPGPA
jgi:hypothetical protein